MFLFYSYKVEDQIAHFDEVEMRHCVNVLRNKPGDVIQFTDGLGHHFEGAIISSNKNGFLANVENKVVLPKHPANNIHVAIAPTKNIDRFEWFLEKATEFGISEITPLICSNSERKNLRSDRLEKILLSAMKQSFSAYLPLLHPITTFNDFLISDVIVGGTNCFIAHCRNEGLPHLFRNSSHGKDVVVLIGPEGDFSIEEIKMAEEKGIQSVSLGTSRLRTETAGIAAVLILNLKNI